jgi:hypothetical protein
MKINQKKIIQLIVSLLLLAIGGMIYLLFRSSELIMFKWIEVFGIDSSINLLRKYTLGLNLSNFIVYSLPNMLWLLSYMLTIDLLWRSDSSKYLIWLSILPIVSMSSEILQIWKIVPGTFDIVDIIAYLMAPVLFLAIKLTCLNFRFLKKDNRNYLTN